MQRYVSVAVTEANRDRWPCGWGTGVGELFFLSFHIPYKNPLQQYHCQSPPRTNSIRTICCSNMDTSTISDLQRSIINVDHQGWHIFAQYSFAIGLCEWSCWHSQVVSLWCCGICGGLMWSLQNFVVTCCRLHESLSTPTLLSTLTHVLKRQVSLT